MSIVVRILTACDEEILSRVAAGVFDQAIDPKLRREFLNDARHHLAVAIDDDLVVGMASAVHYVHPDKPSQLWINEVGVAETHRGRGLGKQLVQALLHEGKRIGCPEAWVLTDRENAPAMRLYSACGGKQADQVMFSFSLQ